MSLKTVASRPRHLGLFYASENDNTEKIAKKSPTTHLDQETRAMTHPRLTSTHSHSLLPGIIVTAAVLGILLMQI